MQLADGNRGGMPTDVTATQTHGALGREASLAQRLIGKNALKTNA